jgi:uncharacterized protein YndB with AHSA1/START domain/DNA-binding transcriptional ArsR family regulator
MVERQFDESALSEILKATSDPTRRSILTSLAQEGPTRVTDLAAYYRMSLNSVSKHIKVLEAAGLVSRRMEGRVHWISAELDRVGLVDVWFTQLRSIWEMRLEKLDAILSEDSEMTDLTLTVNRRINAPAEKVFNAWLDPKMLAKFMLPGETMSVPRVEADAKVGGRFVIVMANAEKEIPHTGAYHVIEPHSRLVFSWESPHSTDGSTVTLNFKPVDGGATDVELVQVKFASDESRDGHMKGWTAILAKLGEVLS